MRTEMPSVHVRMPTAAAIAICVLYFAGVLVSVPVFGPTMTTAFLAAWSAAFAWSYLVFAAGRRITALSIVTIVTVLLPVLALISLVGAHYASPSALFLSLSSEFRGRGPLGGLELFVPLVAARVIVFFASARRTG